MTKAFNKTLAAAGFLTIAYCGVHVFAGGPEVHEPALASDLPPLVKGVFSVVWHTITAFMLLNGLALAWLALRSDQTALGWLVIAQFTAFGGMFIAYGLARFGDLITMPQWTGFWLIAGLAAWGLRYERHEAAN